MHSYMKVKKMIQETPLFRAEISEIQESLTARFSATPEA
jgi:hypothetical protein